MRPVIMVHGAFCGGWIFDSFRQPFEGAGLTVLTPDLPGHTAGDSRSVVAGKSMSDYAKVVADLCRSCPVPPILIGHSMGGLVAQMAAAKAPVGGLILLAPSPGWGISGSSMEEAVSAMSLYALGPFWLQAIEPDHSLAAAYSLDRFEAGTRRAVTERMVPESGRALWEVLNWWLDPFMTTLVAPAKVPALVLSGEHDVIHPPATVRQAAQKLGAEFRTLPGMSHWLPGEPGWQDVAAASLRWMAEAVDMEAA
jgi:pimeloyl-ACP methyl ester carboxylesterase